MKVLLLEDIDKLGYLGDVVEVKSGYARNYLLPTGLATVPNEGAMKSIAQEKAKRAEERRLVRERLEKEFGKFEDVTVSVTAKTNHQGHLFGSVTEKDIAEDLRNQDYPISNDMVKMDHPIKEVGEHEVNVRFAHDLLRSIKVIVVSENEQEEGAPVESAQEKDE